MAVAENAEPRSPRPDEGQEPAMRGDGVAVPAASAAAIALFACMSRFEFALKEANYVAGEQGKRAEVDWGRFERAARQSDVLDRLKASGQAVALLTEPPRKQLRQGDSFAWGSPIELHDGRTLCLAVRQVRNNLFHGGKAGADPRDDALCQDAVAAVIAMLDIDPRVRDAFLGLY